MKEEIKQLLNNLVDDILQKEQDCLDQMGFCNEHNFKMEHEAINYKRQAIADIRAKVTWTRFRINELLDY